MDKPSFPSKKQLKEELFRILDADETTDERAVSALRVLFKYFPDEAMEKALQMNNDGKNRIAVIDMLLKYLPDDAKNSYHILDIKI